MIVVSVQADLSKPETIPATLVGIHTVIDCATGRPEEPIKTVSISNSCLVLCLLNMEDIYDRLTRMLVVFDSLFPSLNNEVLTCFFASFINHAIIAHR